MKFMYPKITVLKNFCILVICFGILASCGGVRVNYDYDSETDFSDYSTYNYREEMASGLGEFDERRFLQAIDSVMQMKGIQFSEEPDFYINIYSDAYLEDRDAAVGVGVGGTNRNIGGGVTVGVPVGRPGIKREIYIDFVDSQRKALFWQAIVQAAINERAEAQERDRYFHELVRKVFEEYPPE